MFSKKSKAERKTGCQPKWNDDDVDDMADLVIKENWYSQTPKIKVIVKFMRIRKELQERAAKRNLQLVLSTGQVRTKFKKCVRDWKNAAMTIKTETEIKRFQDN